MVESQPLSSENGSVAHAPHPDGGNPLDATAIANTEILLTLPTVAHLAESVMEQGTAQHQYNASQGQSAPPSRDSRRGSDAVLRSRPAMTGVGYGPLPPPLHVHRRPSPPRAQPHTRPEIVLEPMSEQLRPSATYPVTESAEVSPGPLDQPPVSGSSAAVHVFMDVDLAGFLGRVPTNLKPRLPRRPTTVD